MRGFVRVYRQNLCLGVVERRKQSESVGEARVFGGDDVPARRVVPLDAIAVHLKPRSDALVEVLQNGRFLPCVCS